MAHVRFNRSTPLISGTLAIMVILLSGILVASIPQYVNKKVYADGLTQENLPPASVGNRQMSLYLKVNPPILTTAAAHNAFMQFRLFDASNNQTIQHVTYQITVTRGTSSSSLSTKPLLLDFFHAHDGLLTLHVEPSPGVLTVYGEQDPFLNSWMADPGGNILIKGPLLTYLRREVCIISMLKYLALITTEAYSYHNKPQNLMPILA